MKKLFFILILSLFVPEKIFAADCADNYVPPHIEIFSSYGKLQYDTSKNIVQLTEIAKKYGLSEQGLFASGLSTVDISTDISVNTLGKPTDDKKICVYPTSIRLFIGFANPLIYISDTIKPHSCEYKVVLRHEQTHQYINKEMLDYFLPLFSEAFIRIVRSTPPVLINNINEVNAASQILTEEYNRKLQPLIEFFKKEMIAEQQRLDNADNYSYEKKLCP